MAIAPTGSISILCDNVSPGIDPIIANAYIHENKTGKHEIRNVNLEKYIKKYAEENGKDNKWIEKQWKEIIKDRGSVQGLEWMSDDAKLVFKTAYEIDQRWIISHAKVRQEKIDQGQSVNLFFRHDVDRSYLTYVHLQAWKAGLKSLYYCRSQSATKASSNHEREIIQEMDKYETCLSCQ
jgi:ribonucleoside-diphosphate reductase alpha chain